MTSTSTISPGSGTGSRISPLFILTLIICGLLFGFGIYSYTHRTSTLLAKDIRTTSERTVPLAQYKLQQAKIGFQTFDFYIADTEYLRNEGLSYVLSLPPKTGMAFRFPNSGRYEFWMKGMKFPLDFVFVHNDLVVELHENISPDTFPNLISPNYAADTILELNAGEVEKYSIDLGSVIKWK